MAEPNPTTPQADVPKYVTVGDLIEAADDLLAQAAERTDNDARLKRIRRSRQQLFAARDAREIRDAQESAEIVTDGGREIVVQDGGFHEGTTWTGYETRKIVIDGDLEASVAVAPDGPVDVEVTVDGTPVDELVTDTGDDDQDDDDGEIVTDGGVAVDRGDADGGVWSRPIVETDRHGDPTGETFVRCLDCGAEVLEQHTDDATHKPGCRHR